MGNLCSASHEEQRSSTSGTLAAPPQKTSSKKAPPAIPKQIRLFLEAKAAKLFDMMDADKSTDLTKAEVESWIVKNPELAKEFVFRLDTSSDKALLLSAKKWRIVNDSDDNGVLDLDEFTSAYIAGVMATEREMQEKQALKFFNAIDKDSSTDLTKEELYSWIMENPEEAKKMIPSLDTTSERTLHLAAMKWRTLADTDDNEVLDLDEFTTTYVAGIVHEQALEASALKFFNMLDGDSSCDLTKVEVEKWIKNNPEKAKGFIPQLDTSSDRKLDLSIRKWRIVADTDENGVLDFDEFASAYIQGMEAMK